MNAPEGSHPDTRQPTFRQRVVEAAGANVFVAAAGGGAGLFLAKVLGATERGKYAAIQSWFGVLTIVGELGLTASTCFYIARDPTRASDWLTTARNLLLVLGTLTAVGGVAITPILVHATSAPFAGFICLFLSMPFMFMAGAWTFALQATDMRRWNYARVISPVAYSAGIVVLGILHTLTVASAAALLGGAIIFQAGVARFLCRNTVVPGRAQRSMVRPLLRYGVSSFAGSVPFAFNAGIDQVVLTFLVSSAQLGNYAVAVSLTLIASPITAAFGNVVMPALARGGGEDERQLIRSALRGAVIVGLLVVTPIALIIPFLATRVLGSSYRDLPVLVALLAPGAVILGCNQVLGDILRGKGRPLDVGRCELAGLAMTAILLSVLVPPLGARGAAIASTVAYSVSLVLLWRRVTADGRGAAGAIKSP